MMLKQKLEEEKRVKREQIEEYKFRKELEKQREKQIEQMEAKKKKEQLLS
jgi:hypothetical protein